MCVLIFCTSFSRNISHFENNSGLQVKYSYLLSDFHETLIFSTDSSKNLQIPNLIKILSVGTELFHADGQTDMKKIIVAFHNFANSTN
jgi:hypothetical protein